MKNLILLLSVFFLSCGVTESEPEPCDVLITEVNIRGGIEKFLICGEMNEHLYGAYIFTDIKYYSFPEGMVSDTLYMRPLSNEAREYSKKNIGEKVSVWVDYHDEAFTYVIAN